MCKLADYGETLAALFNHCGDVSLFVKDAAGRFMKCNRALLRIHGLNREDEMLGKTDHDFHPPLLAEGYVREDRRIMRSGNPIIEATWLVTTHTSSRWYSSTKLPVMAVDHPSEAIGIAGVLVPLEDQTDIPKAYQRIREAIVLADREHAHGLQVQDLADSVSLSRNQFTRVFRKLFHMTPGDYLIRLRLDQASRDLRKTSKSITQIAIDSGFYDHSAFAKAFRKQNGMTPTDFRRRFGKESNRAASH